MVRLYLHCKPRITVQSRPSRLKGRKRLEALFPTDSPLIVALEQGKAYHHFPAATNPQADDAMHKMNLETPGAGIA